MIKTKSLKEQKRDKNYGKEVEKEMTKARRPRRRRPRRRKSFWDKFFGE